MQRPIIIDTDPGIDDAVALLLALASSEELYLRGIVAVAGNLPLPSTERNARRICALAEHPEVPVYGGCARPLMRQLVSAERIHNDPRLDSILPEPATRRQPQHGVDYLIEKLREAKAGEITLCALGPLTNIAMALVKAPEIAGKIGELVIMGGACFEIGNITPAAEFNMHVDPHAAAIALGSGIPITMIPLDVSHQVLTTELRLTAMRSVGNRCGPAVAALLAGFEARRVDRFGERGQALHDPCVIAYLLRPDLFDGRDVNVEIETESQLTLGMTVVDWWGVSGRKPNVRLINTVDAGGLFDLLGERLARLP